MSSTNSIPSSQSLSMQNNLIQNFYIIGFSPEDFFKVDSEKKIGTFADIFKEKTEEFPTDLIPKIITKFPNLKNQIMSIEDDIIISHCFPKGMKITNTIDEFSGSQHFQFELTNTIPCKYSENESEIYSKIYFSCIEINEPLSLYLKYKKQIINQLLKTKTIDVKDEAINADMEKKFEKIYLPKILCFATILPFFNEMSKLLDEIYNIYFSNLNESSPILVPLEKIIEQMIFNIPIPIKPGTQFLVKYKNATKNNLLTSFTLNNVNESCIQRYYNMSMVDVFLNFSIDDIIKIYKSILLEIPILFFSENKSFLSISIENFISLLSPFRYVYPYISILPSSLYGLIILNSKFIFGINQNYTSTFFEDNNLDLNKSLIIVSFDNVNKVGKVEEKIKKINDDECEKLIIESIRGKNVISNNNCDEYIYLNDNKIFFLNIDFPSYEKKKLSANLNNYVSFIKRKNLFSKKGPAISEFNNYKIQNIFFHFLIYLMTGYSDFLLRSSYFHEDIGVRNNGENIFYKMDSINFVREVFNKEEFIAKTPTVNQAFYLAFFKTKMFFTFLHDKIFTNNPITNLKFRQFDQLTFLKKHKDYRKKRENKSLYDDYRNENTSKVTITENKEILIETENLFTKNEFSQLLKAENETKLLINYGQIIRMKISNKKSKTPEITPYLSYLFFPKLLFDDKFFEEKYCDTISSHNLILQNNDNLKFLKTQYLKTKEECEKARGYMFPEEMFKKINKTNNSKMNFQIKYMNYIYYAWLILFSFSLHYCDSTERNIRLTKVFEILNKIEYIEEYVVNVLIFNIYKYCSKFNFIKMWKTYIKFARFTNYYALNLVCKKIQEVEKNNTNTVDNDGEEIDEDFEFRKRQLICGNKKFLEIQKNNEESIKNNNEEIIFSTDQKCIKCKNIFDINPVAEIQEKIDTKVNSFTFKCNNCKNQTEKDIEIKYQVLSTNYEKKHSFTTKTGKFLFYTPYKLYVNLKNYLISENVEKLDILNIYTIADKINLMNLLFYFSLLSLPFDFMFPYWDDIKKENIGNEGKMPIIFSFADEVTVRKFNGLVPVYNPKKRLFRKTESDLSFTIKNIKKSFWK